MMICLFYRLHKLRTLYFSQLLLLLECFALPNLGPIYCSLSNLLTCRFPTSLIACSIVTNLPLSLSLRSATFFRFLHTIFFSNVLFCFFCQKWRTFSYRT